MKTNIIKLETPFTFTQEQLDVVMVDTPTGRTNPETLVVKRVTKTDGTTRFTLKNIADDTMVLTSFPVFLEKGDIITIKSMQVFEISRLVADVAPPAEPPRSPTSKHAVRSERSLF